MKTTAQQKEDLEWVSSVWHRARILEPTFQLNGTVFPTQGQRRSYHDVNDVSGSEEDDDDYTNIVPEALLLQVDYCQSMKQHSLIQQTTMFSITHTHADNNSPTHTVQTSYDEGEDQNGFPSSPYLIGHPQVTPTPPLFGPLVP